MTDTTDLRESLSLPASRVRWRCDPDRLGFGTTAQVTPDPGILGQPDAIEALRYGLETRAHGTNVFVRGLSGYGRMELIHQMIEEIAPESGALPDLCYVRNFDVPDQPRLLSLPQGTGRDFRDRMERFAEIVQSDLFEYLKSDNISAAQRRLSDQTRRDIQALGQPFEKELAADGLVLMPMQVGQNMMPTILPVIKGQPVQFDQVQRMLAEGKMSQPEYERLIELVSQQESRLAVLAEQTGKVQESYRAALSDLITNEADRYIEQRLAGIRQRWPDAAIQSFLDDVAQDLLQHHVLTPNEPDFHRDYLVNLVRARKPGGECAVIAAANPSALSLIGTVDHVFAQSGFISRSDHMMIKPGTLLDADGGFLVVEAQDILAEPAAWQILLRVIKTGTLEIFSADPFGMSPRLRPEAIPVDIKVVLVGDPQVYYLLDSLEPRFAQLFKVLADFSDTLPRDDDGIAIYGNVLARIAAQDQLAPFTAEASALLIEHGARVAAEQHRLTTRFGRIADIAREGAYLARKAGRASTTGVDIREAIEIARRRAGIPARTFQRMIANRSLRIEVEGQRVGQVNGLAVTSAGPIVFGFPSRITASVAIGEHGVVNIERESHLSGAVHTKGFLILRGLLQRLLALDHPLTFSATLAFEQTYGGIDGDSASAAELCCLISALTDIPIQQGLAITGAVDQHGNILPIGSATEKIEGFFNACTALGPAAGQGVIIPESNAEELMLRQDIVDAVDAGRFQVFAVSHIGEALTLLTGRDAGQRTNGSYPEGSVLAAAVARAGAFYAASIKRANGGSLPGPP